MLALISTATGAKRDIAATPADTDRKRASLEEAASTGRNKAASWASNDWLPFVTGAVALLDVFSGADVLFEEVYLLLGEAAATDASGAINVMNESRQAPNTLLLLGVVMIDRYMGSPYRVA
jgi:hypothetical protein